MVSLSGPWSWRRRRAVRAAQAAAEREAPGLLHVFDAESMGEAGGHAALAALTDDPDAVVHLGIAPGGRALRTGTSVGSAIADARARAAELRALRTGFAAAGPPLVGARVAARHDDPVIGAWVAATVVVAAPVDATTIAGVTATLERAVAAWHDARRDLPPVDPVGVDVLIVAPHEVERGEQASAGSLRNRPSGWHLERGADRLGSRARHRAGGRVRDGVVRPVRLSPVLGPAERRAFAAEVERAAEVWLAERHTAWRRRPALHAAGPRYLPGTTERLRAYAGFRSAAGTGDGPEGPGGGGDDTLVALTVDRDGRRPADGRLLPLVLTDGDPEPDLA